MRLVYISNFDNSGVPSALNVGDQNQNIKKTISSAVLTEVNQRFPERKLLFNTHPEWIQDNTLMILNNVTIKITFVDEGAGYKNAFGYYIYQTVNPPTKVSDIDNVYVIFPNASKQGKGGSLQAGDTMQLAYEFTTNTVNNLVIGVPINYTFPANTSVGFVIFANGWRGNYVNKNVNRYFTDSRFNPEKTEWLKRHTALVKLTTEPIFVMGLEDLHRGKSGCDHDFNDLIVVIETSDNTAISEESYAEDTPDLNNPPTQFKVGFKKCFADVIEDNVSKVTEVIVELYIPPTSVIVSNNYTDKLRTDRAYVSKIVGMDHVHIVHNTASNNYIGHSFNTCHSKTDGTFVYDKNDWVQTTLNTDPEIHGEGIHYFATYEEARSFTF